MNDFILKYKAFHFNNSESVFVIENVSQEEPSKMPEYTFASCCRSISYRLKRKRRECIMMLSYSKNNSLLVINSLYVYYTKNEKHSMVVVYVSLCNSANVIAQCQLIPS